MSRYIDAEQLWKYANNQKDKSVSANDFMRFPYINIVHCRECKYTDNEPPIADGRSWCRKHYAYMYYCSDGERNNNDESEN